MAGRRHHILPRFLLKGFAKETKRDQVYTWLYAKGRSPVPANILNIAVESDFYGKPEADVNADQAITEIEKSYVSLVENLRQAPLGPVKEATIGSWIAHLSARTKHLRMSFEESGVQLVDEMAKLLSDGDRFETIMLAKMADKTFFREQIRTALPAHLRTPAMEESLLPLMQKMAPEFLAQNRAQIAVTMLEIMRQFRTAISEAAVTGQNRALLKMSLETPRSELFQRLDWRVENRNEALILGDSGALFLLKGDPVFHPYPEDSKNIAAIYLPLAKHRLLIGTTRPEEEGIDTAVLNVAAVRCSREFYVSALGPEEHGHFVTAIGLDAVFFSRERIEEVALEYFSGSAKPAS
jgi:hypothetical protein